MSCEESEEKYFEPPVPCVPIHPFFICNNDNNVQYLKEQLLDMVRKNGFEKVFTTLKTVVKEEYERTLRDWEYLQALMGGKLELAKTEVEAVASEVKASEVKASEAATEAVPVNNEEKVITVEPIVEDAVEPAVVVASDDTTKHLEIASPRATTKKVLRKKAH